MLEKQIAKIPMMGNLQQVCTTLLDNADLDVYLDGLTATIRLEFVVGGSLEKVTFECSDFHSFTIVKLAEENQCLFVGETRVNIIENPGEIENLLNREGWLLNPHLLPQKLYEIKVDGAVKIVIICEKFTWKIQPASPE